MTTEKKQKEAGENLGLHLDFDLPVEKAEMQMASEGGVR